MAISEDSLSGFGERLRKERKLHDWTHEELAKLIPCSVITIARWENNKAVIRAPWIERLSSVFGRPPERWGTSKWWNVPYRRNRYFMGREEILQRLRDDLTSTRESSCKIYAITAMGGMGKTQVVLEFAYRYSSEFDAVLWIRAGSKAIREADVLSIAKMLSLDLTQASKKSPGTMTPEEALQTWLVNHDRCLLILDNADTPNVDIMVACSDILPHNYNGAMLITTRLQPVGTHVKCIKIEKMSIVESTSFLLRRISTDTKEKNEHNLPMSEKTALSALCTTMDGLPLALEQAAAYIRTAPCNMKKYMALYQKGHQNLLKVNRAQNSEYPETVATTWNVSFQHINGNNSALENAKTQTVAAELLRLCAFLSSDGIPEELFTWGKAHCPAKLLNLVTSEKLESAIRILYRYSLIQRDFATQALQVHRLVQTVLIDAMPTEVRKQWQARVIRILNAAFPVAPASPEDWPRYALLLPHVQKCAVDVEPLLELTSKEIKQGAETLEVTAILDAADLFGRAGSYLRELGSYEEAETLLTLALSIRKKYASADSLSIAKCLRNLAGVYFYQDKYERAKGLIQNARAIYEQQLGNNDPITIENGNGLGLIYLREERYEQAKPLLMDSLAYSEQYDGPESAMTANKMSNLALVYLGQEQYEEAEALLRKAFFIDKRCLGIENPETARTLENLAFVYMKQGRPWRAKPLLSRALCTHIDCSGLQSPDTAYPLYGFAEIYRFQRNFEKSERYHLQTLSIRQKCLEANHLDIAESLLGLADLYQEWERYEESERLYKCVLKIRKKILGWESPSIVKTRKASAAVQQKIMVPQT